jgi:predicted Zn finger-like uncharacterized protein
MRFECDSCHAKYKISDEKVRGRVVRFPCRKCDHKILIDGREGDPDVTVPAGPAYGFDVAKRRSEPVSTVGHEAPTARARRPSSAVRRRQSSVPPRRPSVASRTLSSDPVAAQHPGLTPPVPVMSAPGAGDVPEWHVSINDVPVGPIRLEEMAHKIDASAVSEYTLVWRDGFDDWRPLATVPELMALLHERRHSGPPSRTSFSSMPPFVDSRTSIAESEMPAAPSSRPPAAELVQQDVLVDFAPLADVLQPETGWPDGLSEMSQPPAQLGPEDVFPSSPQLGSFLGLPAEPDELVSVPSVPPEAAGATAEPRSGLSLGVLALIIAVAVFAAVVVFLSFDRFGDSSLSDLLGTGEAAPIAAPSPAPVAAPEVAVAQSASEQLATEDGKPFADGEEAEAVSAGEVLEGEAGEGQGVEGEAAEGEASQGEAAEAAEGALSIEPPNPRDDGPKLAPARSSKPKVRRSPRPNPAADAPQGESLSADEQKVLNDFGSSADAAPAKIDVEKSGSTQSNTPSLDGHAVRATVTTNKPRLQRCYERAIRGQQSSTTVRLDVTLTVASSGRVKDVNAVGNGPGGLAECVEASVRRWRFPASSEGGPAQFPIVFSAN